MRPICLPCRPGHFLPLIFALSVLFGAAAAARATSVNGPTTVCTGGTNSFAASNEHENENPIYAWSFTTNTAAAVILGDTNQATVQILSATNGSFTLALSVTTTSVTANAEITVTALASTTASPLASQIVCPGTEVAFATLAEGTGPFAFLWRKDGLPVPDGTNSSLILSNVASGDAGNYCVEVTGACGSVTNCAALAVISPPPPIGCPAPVTVECLTDVPAPNTNLVATGPVAMILHLGDSIATNGCELAITRIYGVVNSCNLTSTCNQTITVRDTTPPTLTCAATRIVACGDIWDFDTPLVADACDTNVLLTIAGTITNNLCGATFSATRIWLATDACGNTNSCSQTIDVVDTTAPLIVCNTNRSVECSAAWDFDTPLVSDSCDTNVLLTISGTITNNLCGATFSATRTWLATDACGNTNSCSQTIEVVDTTAPLIVCNTNRIVECSAAWEFDTPLVSDACDTNVALTITGTITNNLCGATFSATRTWLATDACGNTNSCSQTIDVVDTTPPLIACNTNRIVECSAAWDFDTPLVSDACDTNVALTITGTITNNLCGATFSATRTWLATDACGNTNSCSQTIEVVDTTAPLIVCNTNRSVECSAAWDFDTPLVSDACDSNVLLTITGTVTNNLCGATFTATRTWLATDACGNTNACSQTIKVVDTTAPIIACSSNIVVECVGPAGTPVSFAITAMDTCDTNVLIYSVPPAGTAFTLGTNTVNAYAVDACHNTNTCSFTVTILDTTPPTIACPANLIAAENPRDSGSAPVTYAAPVVSDICDASLALVTLPPSGFAFPVGTNTVHAVVTDESGNTNACSFQVRVIPYRLYVTNLADAGPGTLRQAILDANAAPGENLVLFNLPGLGLNTIPLASALPEITSPIILNGWSQPGFVNKPLVEVTGNYLTNRVDGLVIRAGASTVRGLILNGFANALSLITNGNNVVQGNFIGTDSAGTDSADNVGDGLYITTSGNLIGGTTNLSGNVIGGNGGSGIHLDGAGATLNLIRGNWIGLGWDGASPVGNGLDGVRLRQGAARNGVGAIAGGATNLIAFNARNGVTLEPTAGNQNGILINLLRHNGALGIDLGNDGPTANDVADSDTGPNQLQNHPELTDARHDGGLVIEGTLSSKPNTSYRLDFWLNDTADPSGYGEGQYYLGTTTLVLDESGAVDFAVGFAVPAVHTQFVTAVATDPQGNTSEFSPARQVRTPPVLASVPATTNAAAGGSVTFCASATGTPPIFFQWRHNGANIAGATSQCYTIPLAQVSDAGNYSVVVFNALGGTLTPPAQLLLAIPNVVAAGDDFQARVTLTGRTNQIAASNRNATREHGEPLHAGKPGDKSVWYTWKAPERGIMTIGTPGSDFDTLLGIYTGSSVTNLTPVASDEDGGGFFTSGARFNVFEDKYYHFAIDGYGGEAGNFIFGWSFDETDYLLPVFTNHPQSQTVAPGSPVTFTAKAVRVCKRGHLGCWDEDDYPHDEIPLLGLQWYFENAPLAGKTSNSLTISNVQPENVGKYTLQATLTYRDDHDHHYHIRKIRIVESAAADLQINLTGDGTEGIQAKDKLLDALLSAPWIIGNESSTAGRSEGGGVSLFANTVVRGYTGTQIFNTAGSSTSVAEDPICGVLGGASEWITFVAVESGDLFLNTDGSSYDTVMAIFARNPNNPALLTQIACDNNGGLDHLDSALIVPVTVGQTNAILIDGVNGASGTLKLNYSLVPKTSIKAMGLTPDNKNILQVSGRTNLNFSIQRSTNLIHWATVLTTNAPSGVFNYLDSTGGGRQFYRVKVLP